MRDDQPLWLKEVNREIVACTRCPRLVKYLESVTRQNCPMSRNCYYWGKPVPGFGDPNARVLILGLAPGAHGANRTGRPFTGDAAGQFLYPVLFQTGFANQPTATDRNDGLKLKDLYITEAVHCAPPQNKPLPSELENCAPFLEREMEDLRNLKVVVALGKIGFDVYLNYLKHRAQLPRVEPYVFAHGARYEMPNGKTLLASYHPSQQNTQTGKLTRSMFVRIFEEATKIAHRA